MSYVMGTHLGIRYLKIVHLYYHKSARVKDCIVCCEIPILPLVDARPTQDWCALIDLADQVAFATVRYQPQATNITKYSHHSDLYSISGLADHKAGGT
jgi:hypothetical protein